MSSGGDKAEDAFRTIGELSTELGIQQHILRYWETRFPQLRPLQRAGNRRYYRPTDVALAHRIHQLLNKDGYTIRGVQQVLSSKAPAGEAPPAPAPAPALLAQPQPVAAADPQPAQTGGVPADELRSLRSQLAQALEDSAIS